ncbi:HNH endonuclease [Lachnoclostridium sp.]|uniref:HNH endonuclease n=1 Tax=Lachnoclostridium sp. TaxID=2028282 RepID=UPI0028A1C8D8|nr:HNH endonuclease [Lachnoclostridium sp.]
MREQQGAKPKLLRYFKENIGEQIHRDILKEVVNNVGGWERSLRMLRDDGYEINYDSSTKCYCFPYPEPKNEPKDRRYISKKLNALVIIRDNSTCQMCGKNVKDDHIRVHIDHIVPLSWGGKTELDNLQVLCSNCNEGKKNFVEGENPELMQKISIASNTKERLKLYFEHYSNRHIEVDKLSVIARTREWTRQLRYLRSENSMDIEYVPRNKAKGVLKESYIYNNK